MGAPKNPFVVLGVPARFGLDPAELERRQRELYAASEPAKRVTQADVNEAYRRLQDPVERASFLFGLRGWSTKAPLDPDLLKRVFSEREQIEKAQARGDEAFLLDWVMTARKRRDELVTSLGQVLDGSESESVAPIDALVLLDELRYLSKAIFAAETALDAVEP